MARGNGKSAASASQFDHVLKEQLAACMEFSYNKFDDHHNGYPYGEDEQARITTSPTAAGSRGNQPEPSFVYIPRDIEDARPPGKYDT
eukprot:GSA25T00021366001.1